MARRAQKHLSFGSWPSQDQVLWQQTFEPDAFDDDGRTAHLAEASAIGLRTAYARYLGYLTHHDPQRLQFPPQDRLDLDSVRGFVAHLRETCRDTTVASLLHNLRRTFGYMFEQRDLSWLKTIASRIEALAMPRGDTVRGITSADLYAVGQELMAEAEEAVSGLGAVTAESARIYRDGLIIALLATVPLRRRTLTALTISGHLVRTGESWTLDIPAADTKTARALEFPLPDDVAKSLHWYFARFRGHLSGARDHDGLWPSSRSKPMADGSIYDMVRRRTKEALGVPVNLHRFRLAAGNLWAGADPASVQGVRDLLGHSSFDTTQKNYIEAQSRLAGRALASMLSPVDRALFGCRNLQHGVIGLGIIG